MECSQQQQIWKENLPGRRHGKCAVPEVRPNLASLRTRRRDKVSGANSLRKMGIHEGL